jgi:hypothetical protein
VPNDEFILMTLATTTTDLPKNPAAFESHDNLLTAHLLTSCGSALDRSDGVSGAHADPSPKKNCCMVTRCCQSGALKVK